MSERCSRLLIERLIGGELTGATLDDTKRHIGTCTECSTYAAMLETQRASFLQKHPFAAFARAHAPLAPAPWYRSAVQTLGRRPVLIPAFGTLLIVAIVLPQLLGYLPVRRPEVLYKGTLPLSCMVKRDGIVRSASEIARFRAGDQVQVMFPLEKKRYVSMLSIDSKGTISFYHPDRQSTGCSIAARPGPSVAFPGSVVLDGTPGAELIVVLVSEKELETVTVAAWAKKQFEKSRDPRALAGSITAGEGILDAEIATLLLPKE